MFGVHNEVNRFGKNHHKLMFPICNFYELITLKMSKLQNNEQTMKTVKETYQLRTKQTKVDTSEKLCIHSLELK